MIFFIITYLILGILLLSDSYRPICEKTNFPLLIFSLIVLIWPIAVIFATISVMIQVSTLLKRKNRKSEYEMRKLQD